jgi:hypothetical protein
MSLRICLALQCYGSAAFLVCALLGVGPVAGCLPSSGHSDSLFTFNTNTAVDVYVYTPTGLPRRMNVPAKSAFITDLSAWLSARKDGWRSSFETYAPQCLIKGKGFVLNIRTDVVVLNCEEAAGKWKQVVCQADPSLEITIQEFLSRQSSTLPLDNLQTDSVTNHAGSVTNE